MKQKCDGYKENEKRLIEQIESVAGTFEREQEENELLQSNVKKLQTMNEMLTNEMDRLKTEYKRFTETLTTNSDVC